jgi:chromosome segregation ATPase
MSRVNGSLTVEREALERCADRMSAMAVQAPALDAKMDAILGKLPLVAEGTERARALSETVATLTNHLRTLNGRLPLIERLEGRLTALDELSQAIDQRLTAENAKHADLEKFQKACEALRTELADVQQQLDTLRAVEDRVAPLTDDIDALTNDVTAARKVIASLKVDAGEAVAFEQRYVELVKISKALSTEISERMLQVQALSEELSRSASIKDDLIAELGRVQEQQHEFDGRARLTEDWLARAESTFKELDERIQSSWVISLKWKKPGAGSTRSSG